MRKKLNNKGFTLIEVLAVIVILSILMAIMVPSVGNIMKKNKEDNYQNLKDSIISAAKIYISDNRYQITVGSCTPQNAKVDVLSINDQALSSSKLPINFLVDAGNLKTTSDGKIVNPKDKKSLNLNSSYVVVKYQCDKKEYEYQLKENFLQWQ